jgi:hypothetical protein
MHTYIHTIHPSIHPEIHRYLRMCDSEHSPFYRHPKIFPL